MEKALGIEVRPAPSAEACVRDADVVVTITKSAEPVIRAEWLRPGAHVNAAGGNSADRREIDADTVLRAAVKATDQVAQAKVEAAEYRDLVAAGSSPGPTSANWAISSAAKPRAGHRPRT